MSLAFRYKSPASISSSNRTSSECELRPPGTPAGRLSCRQPSRNRRCSRGPGRRPRKCCSHGSTAAESSSGRRCRHGRRAGLDRISARFFPVVLSLPCLSLNFSEPSPSRPNEKRVPLWRIAFCTLRDASIRHSNVRSTRFVCTDCKLQLGFSTTHGKR